MYKCYSLVTIGMHSYTVGGFHNQLILNLSLNTLYFLEHINC